MVTLNVGWSCFLRHFFFFRKGVITSVERKPCNMVQSLDFKGPETSFCCEKVTPLTNPPVLNLSKHVQNNFM